MTFYRHFILRKDFDTLVATNSPDLKDYQVPYEPVVFDAHPLWRRLRNTRLHTWICSIEALYGSFLLPSHVIRTAKAFGPDAVFTMGGSWDWTALAAQRTARLLNVPLISSFNDWYDYPWFRGHPSQRKRIEARFFRFYRESNLALCTSPGMKEALGDHPNAHVWYPTGAAMPEGFGHQVRKTALDNDPCTVLFAGGLGEWYGPMLEKLVMVCREHYPKLKFIIYGSLQTWSREFEEFAVQNGIFKGRIPFESLRASADQVDFLLLPMGFQKEAAHIESTSFKTKFLDYLTFQKPIIVWGPEYCSSVRVAREFDSAECVTDSHPKACAFALDRLSLNLSRQSQLVENARKMYEGRFHPDCIHNLLVKEIRQTCRL